MQSGSPSNQSKHEHKTWPTHLVCRDDLKHKGKFGRELFKNVQGSIVDELVLSKVREVGYPRQIRQRTGIDDEDSAGPKSSRIRQEEQEKSSKQP